MNRQGADFDEADDYFATTRMSLGDHIDELRIVLLRACKGLVLGMIVGFFLAQPVMALIQRPVEQQLKVFYKERAERKMKELHLEMEANKGELQATNVLQPMTCLISFDLVSTTLRQCQSCHGPTQQLGGLRLDSREDLLKGGKNGSIINAGDPEASLFFQAIRRTGKLAQHPIVNGIDEEANKQLVEWIKKDVPWPKGDDRRSVVLYFHPAEVWHKLAPAYREIDHPPILKALSITETIIIWMKIGFYCGVIISSPWLFYQIWMFIAAGLYPEEKRLVHYYLPLSIFLFICGVVLCYYVLPIGIHYLLNFNAWLNISPTCG